MPPPVGKATLHLGNLIHPGGFWGWKGLHDSKWECLDALKVHNCVVGFIFK